MTKIKVKNTINKYIALLKKRGVNVQKAILFGSYAKDTAHKMSDIDLAVISTDFGRNGQEDMLTLARLSTLVSSRLSPVPLRPEALKLKYDTLVGEIKKYGQVIYSS